MINVCRTAPRGGRIPAQPERMKNIEHRTPNRRSKMEILLKSIFLVRYSVFTLS